MMAEYICHATVAHYTNCHLSNSAGTLYMISYYAALVGELYIYLCPLSN